MPASPPPEPLISPTAATARVTGGRFKRVLGTPSLVLFGLVYMVPLTVFTTYGIVTELTGGRVPMAYAITLVAMVFTARSYARMSVAYPFAGSAYVYTQRSFGGAVGFLAGWALLLDYLFLPMINYLLIGIYLEAAFPAVPAWVFILVSIVVVTALNIVGIVSVTRTNLVIIALQAVFIALFLVLGLASLSGRTVDPLAPFTGDGSVEGIGVLFAGAAVLCLSFLGFDSVSTLAEEAREPTRTVPRAIMITTVVAGLAFFALSYLSQLVFPSNEFTSVDAAALDVVQAAGGQVLAVLFTAGYIAGSLGSALTSQASVSRILFAMGRDGVLPKGVFGRLSERFGTPVIAISVVSAISSLAIVFDLALLAAMISFGALIAFSAVNLSVVKHYFLDRRERGGMAVVNDLVLPLIGFALTVWLWTSLAPSTFVVGLSWLAVGVVILAIVTRGFRRPTPMLDLKE
ncbi:MAG: APC family permease [Agromyces sp.]